MKIVTPTFHAMFTVALLMMGLDNVHSQAVPATPKKFAPAGIGERGGGASVGFTPAKPQTTTKAVTHIVLGTPRQWKYTDGRFFVGKLIAFEDLNGAVKLEQNPKLDPAGAPGIPAKPTVVRDGKARFIVNSKVYEIALDRLGEEERKFIESVRAGIAAKK